MAKDGLNLDAGRRQVWIVNHYAAGPDEPSGTRHYALARRLVARGHQVTIFAASLDHATGRDRIAGRLTLARRQTVDGVQFVWLRTVPYRGNTLRRQLNMLSFLVMFLVAQAGDPAPDVIIGSTVHPFAAWGAWLAAKVRGARFLFEIRDLWPQTLVDLGAMRLGSPVERGLRLLEAFLVRRASSVITLLPGIRDYLREQGLPSGHVVYIPNGADLDAFAAGLAIGEAPDEVAATLAEAERLRAAGRFVIGYTGAFGRVNRCDLIARAAVIAERRMPGRVGLILVGDGPERPVIERAAAGSPAVCIGRPIPKRWVPGLLRAVDATVVHTTFTPVYRYGISFNKLFEYMAAGRPVVFACDSAYDPVRSAGAGVSIPPDDPEGLATAFLELADASPEVRDAMGAAGRDYVSHEHSFEPLDQTLAMLVEGGLSDADRS